VRQRLRLFVRATVVRNANASSPLPKAINRASRAVTLDAQGIARATVIGNDNGGCTRHEDPGPSHWLREERATSPPVPHAERRVAACSFRCTPTALSRLQCGTCTAPTLGAGWCRVRRKAASVVSSVARLLRVLEPFPPAFFSSIRNHRPEGPQARRPEAAQHHTHQNALP
jgi:hypothetical protein